jgi:cell division protein ZapA
MQRGTPVDVRVGQKTYRVVATSDHPTLERLAALVDQKLSQIDSRHPDALVLAALALAHDVDELGKENQRLRGRTRHMLGTLLSRVDEALDHVDENGDPLPPPQQSWRAASGS